MNLMTLIVSALLVAQAGEPDRYAPRVQPTRKGAPPAQVEPPDGFSAPPSDAETPPATAPAETEPPAEPPAEPAHHAGVPRTHASAGETEPEAGGQKRVRPPDLVAEALEHPVEGALVGTPLTLQAALAHTNDRTQQLRITQTYWRLCTAQADYHWALNERELLKRFTESHTNSANTLAARATARAEVRDMQLAVAKAQQDLLEQMGTQGDAALPLASDFPHVGDYNTYYESIFANRTPPPRMRLIHRTLPVLRQAIEAHGEAIVRAIDALEGAGEGFEKSGHGLATVLLMLEQVKQERRTFMNDVRDYNQNIAEYAFAVAPPTADGRTLVSMLIRTAPKSLEPQRGVPQNATPGERTFHREVPREEDSGAVERSSLYQHEPTEERGPYQALSEVPDAPQRVQKLANLLHWDRNLPADSGKPTALADCLRNIPASSRPAVIGAYWRTRERAARYQAAADQQEQLNALPAIAISLRDQPGVTEASVRLQAARLAAKAAVFDAQAALLAAEFELTSAAGRRIDESWLLPSTPPQSGRYVVAHADTNPTASPAHQRSTIVHLQHEKLEERADAVIRCDAHRAAVVNEARQGAEPDHLAPDEPMRLDSALRAISRQHRSVEAFLRDLTAYNIAIARYALGALPQDIPSDELVKKLVIARSTRREG